MNNDIQKTVAASEELERRLSDMAMSKSRLELINRLLISLSSVAGLDNMVEHILNILMQTIGAANISIFFHLDGTWHFRDIYGANRLLQEPDDPDVVRALSGGEPLRIRDPRMQAPCPGGSGSVAVENWILPLLSRERKVGVVCMEGMQLTDKSIFEELQPFFVYATQMRQVVMNLVINASEAIGDKSGVIAITTGCMECDKHYLKDVWLDENISAGLYVYLEISDSGCGMDRETLSKIFDPFFTTKFTGRGLGMSAVLGIVRGHRGAIRVYSEPGKGTSFKILLPASGRPVEIFNVEAHKDDWQGSGTVLLVDDEETVRDIGTEMLKELGFTVITANDGRQALEVFKSTPDVSFVILDLTMPHMDGEQCFRELRLLKPDVKVIICSGYNEYEVTQKFVGKGLAGFVQKPYKLNVLKEAVRGLKNIPE